MKADPSYDAAYREHAKHVWAIVYRMTGSAQDADDIVQDTFVRAMARERLPEGEMRPWLGRIASNAGIDLLRQRRRRGYVGPWLPEPIDTEDDASADASEAGADAGYDLLESASFAFLLALEALQPRPRAVLLLRDVFDYSVREVAGVLDMSETHVKVTHHRARRMMETYDQERCIPTRELQERTRAVLASLMASFVTRDTEAIERLLTESVRSVSDSDGDFFAARVPVVGRPKVSTFWTRTTQYAQKGGVDIAFRMLNGLPAIVASRSVRREGTAPRTVIMVQLDARGSVVEVRSIVALRKLARLMAPVDKARAGGR
ncbi:sigma-70 family RNA polymerase sigma factor [Pendulispora rubella]|uniref:Sigma-70 family RNA polymerase sigma factor n=1 Tax=Pendulispora rubella TaxID=2741070 RepID=A0ABZ2L1Y0_9BACT